CGRARGRPRRWGTASSRYAPRSAASSPTCSRSPCQRSRPSRATPRAPAARWRTTPSPCAPPAGSPYWRGRRRGRRENRRGGRPAAAVATQDLLDRSTATRSTGTSFPSARWTSSTRRCSSSGTASASLAARTWSPRPASSSTSPETRYLYLHIHSTSALNSACWVFHVPFSCFPSHGICFNSRALDSAINLHHTFRLVSHCHTSLGVNQNHRFLARYTKARVT
ncbi:hypothetical protein Zm00014a_033008, partial [Zea mays]